MQWMNELDKTIQSYGRRLWHGRFPGRIAEKGYIDENKQNGDKDHPKTEQGIRKKKPGRDLWQVEKRPNRVTMLPLPPGTGDEINQRQAIQIGDTLEQIDFTASIRNAQISHG